ncbi:T9SS type A sorting domain-containing protein, partial [bacterium]|nr:T9SS type A sorting domain-containing protein [bacterium]
EAETNSGQSNGAGFNPFYLEWQENVEVGGINVEYYYGQTHGMMLTEPGGYMHIHHNLLNDKGNIITYRHGKGVKAIAIIVDDSHIENDYIFEYNLIKRARQNGMNQAMKMYENEIYIDSWSTNSFAIQPTHKSGHVSGNKIFITGYNSFGSGWSTDDFVFENNLIHMESIITMTGEDPYTGNRYFETWGDIDCLAGIRITNYSAGGQVRNNLLYRNNLIIGNCRGGAEMKGTELMTDYSIANTRVEDTQIKVMVTDTSINNRASCVSTHGAYNSRQALPLFYDNCKLISNFCNIRFGDAYAIGDNHRFINCELIKEGAHPDYHSFVFDGGDFGINHQLINCEFLNGAQYDDVFWKNTVSCSYYGMGHAFCIYGTYGTIVRLKNALDNIIFTTTIPISGVIDETLLYSAIHATDWTPTSCGSQVTDLYNYQEISYSPYTLIWTNGVKSETIKFELDSALCVTLDDEVVGIDDINNSSLLVFPNPTQGLVSIKGLENNSPIYLENLLAQKQNVVFIRDNDHISFDMSMLKNGIYILKMENKTGKTEFAKIIKY